MAKNKYDWEAIEKDYRLGQLSIRAIAEKYGLNGSYSAITAKAKKYGWTRNVAKRVQELTRDGLIVNAQANNAHILHTPTREDIEQAALTNIQVINRHRNDIRQGRQLVFLLMGQLFQVASSREELEQEVMAKTQEDQTIARRNSMLKAIALPTHASILRDLSTALKNLIPLERQAYNISEEVEVETYEQRLMRLAKEANDV